MTIWQRIKTRLGLYERRFINDPLRDVPELREVITDELQQRNGSDARNCQAVADALVFAVQYVIGASVEGDIAEFGCMTGRTATVFSGAMASFRTNKALHLFDSFEGLPKTTNEIDAASFHIQEGAWRPGTCKGISPETLRKRCESFLKPEQVKIYEGWFSQTMSKIAPGTKFGLLHIDCDLYESTRDVLEHVFNKQMVTEGAIFLFDDWHCNRASNSFGERKAWAEAVNKYQIVFSDLGSYGWASHKLIVHSYSAK